jgi:hypothetical protein
MIERESRAFQGGLNSGSFVQSRFGEVKVGKASRTVDFPFIQFSEISQISLE